MKHNLYLNIKSVKRKKTGYYNSSTINFNLILIVLMVLILI